MKVYTYFDPIPHIFRDDALIDLWRTSWSKHGWEPHILRRRDAKVVSPATVDTILASRELRRGPCPPGYNAACHLRWVALLGQSPGLMVDYDVLNTGFLPGHLDEVLARSGVGLPVFLAEDCCPCAVYATREAVQQMLQAILSHSYQVDSGHLDPKTCGGELSFVCHDQAIFSRFPERWTSVIPAPCRTYDRDDPENWADASMIHFCNDATPHPRGDYIITNQLLTP